MSDKTILSHYRHERALNRTGMAFHAFRAAAERYVLNILVALPIRSMDSRWVSQLFDGEGVVSILRPFVAEYSRRASLTVEDARTKDEAFRKRLIRCIDKKVIRPRKPVAIGQPVGRNVAALATMFGFDEVEHAVLCFLIVLHSAEALRYFCETLGEVGADGAADIIAAAIGSSPEEVTRALTRRGRLVGGGLVRLSSAPEQLDDKLDVSQELLEAIHSKKLTQEELAGRFLTTAAPPTLDWTDFAHLHHEVEGARDVLRAALQQRRPGINVLFHGAIGTGKSELSRLIAKELGAALYVVGRANEGGESAKPSERLSSLMVANRIIADGRSLLLFDELEDIFSWGNAALVDGHGALHGSKQWLNELLETNPVPTIWITNKADIDPAFLRRFACVVEFREHGQRQRVRVLERHLGADTKLSAKEIDSLAQQFHSSPAQIGSAVAIAKMLSSSGEPDRTSIERILAPIEKLVTGIDPMRRQVFDAASFRLDALNSSADLEGLADRLADWKADARAGISICLYGPPGTGKSEFAKYLAHRMGRPLMVMRASDLLDCYVGGTEQRIAAAFRRAEDDDALLLLDEVDSLLRDRQMSQRSWEVTQVNELLQQLESFRGVVVCTTNLWGNLDEAALRRFIHKIEFRYLRPAQAMVLFRAMFANCSLDESSARRLSALSQLSPGDFAVVARQARTSGQSFSASAVVTALENEVRVKPGAPTVAGFAARRSLNDPSVANSRLQSHPASVTR